MSTLQEVSTLIGREAEVEKLTTGKYVVLWLSFSSSPPPVGDTEEEAIKNFIKWYKEDSNGRSRDTVVESDGTENRSTEVSS